MKNIKFLSFILMMCLLFNSVSYKVSGASETENDIETNNLVDLSGETELNSAIIGGGIIPGNPTEPVDITSGTYYINNAYCGKYLYCNRTAFSLVSGHVSTLSVPIKWLIQESDTDGQYVLRMSSDPTIYIGASSTASSNAVEVVSVSGTTPSRCKWQIYSANGGYFLKNVYNSKYLYTYGASLNTTSSIGNYGSLAYDSCVWRLVTQSAMTGTELTSLSIDSMTMWPGDSMTLDMTISPSTARWTNLSDFTITGYSTTYVTFNSTTGVFTAKSTVTSLYSTTVTVTHKATGISDSFTIAIKPGAILIGVPDTQQPTHDHSTALENISSTIIGWGYSSANVYSGSYTVAQVDNFLNNDANSIFISRSHGLYYAPSNVLQYTYICPYDGNYNIKYTSTHVDSTFSSNELANMDLVMFIGCHTGYGGEGAENLPTLVVEKGVTTAIGFENTIYCSQANEWLERFIGLLDDGITVYSACSTLSDDYTGYGLETFVVCGDKNATFGD